MMTAHSEEAALQRIETLALAKRFCREWGYWCSYGKWGDKAGSKPMLDTGGMERWYRSPPQWNPPEPKFPEANEVVGMAVQKAYIYLPDRPGFRYRTILRLEYCVRPWLVKLEDGQIEEWVARRSRVSIGAYDQVLERALISLTNIMKHKMLWKGLDGYLGVA